LLHGSAGAVTDETQLTLANVTVRTSAEEIKAWVYGSVLLSAAPLFANLPAMAPFLDQLPAQVGGHGRGGPWMGNAGGLSVGAERQWGRPVAHGLGKGPGPGPGGVLCRLAPLASAVGLLVVAGEARPAGRDAELGARTPLRAVAAGWPRAQLRSRVPSLAAGPPSPRPARRLLR
jgi:hypothetical protein